MNTRCTSKRTLESKVTIQCARPAKHTGDHRTIAPAGAVPDKPEHFHYWNNKEADRK